jgi:phosphonate metabolism protein PhnN/1,5-bisphosphokinase (PRPP-forming)
MKVLPSAYSCDTIRREKTDYGRVEWMLIAVVGPSGAGKDTLMAGARAALAQDSRFRFARRAITRPAEAGSEDHEALSDADFAARRAAGGFALSWDAHGLHYGIPRDIEDDMAARRVVIANLSRAVLPEASARYRLRVLNITAPMDVLAARLAARGRESAADIASRLSREVALPDGLDIERVINDADVAEGVTRVLAALNRAASDAQEL